MRRERKHYTPEEKVSILRRHLLDKVPVSTLCEELQLQPTVFYHWLKQLFENGAVAFQRPRDSSRKHEQERMAEAQTTLRNHSVESAPATSRSAAEPPANTSVSSRGRVVWPRRERSPS